MIDVRQAAAAAEAFVRKLFPAETRAGVRLEEVERSDDARTWMITLGWVDSSRSPTSELSKLLAPDGPRIYKTLRVDAESGEVTSMKIRVPA